MNEQCFDFRASIPLIFFAAAAASVVVFIWYELTVQMWKNMHWKWKHARTYGINMNFYWCMCWMCLALCYAGKLWQATWRKRNIRAATFGKRIFCFYFETRNESMKVYIVCVLCFIVHCNGRAFNMCMCTSNNTHLHAKMNDLRTHSIRQVRHLLRFRLLYFYLWIRNRTLAIITAFNGYVSFYTVFFLCCFMVYALEHSRHTHI